MSQSDGVLDGIKVVEFAQNAAIPHCGRLLAGLGADVVKVEPPSGDAMRLIAPIEGEGRAFVIINPGKRAVALDLGSPDARTVTDALLRWADVALVAFKLPDLERYGLDWERAGTVNPRLIHLVHTALGPDGPDADQGGYDGLVQGRSGLGWMMNRSGGSAPQPTRPAISDFSTGFVSAFAVLAGLRHRDQTGEGQRVDTSLLGTAMSLATPTSAWFPDDAEALDELDTDLAAMRGAGLDFDAQRAHYESLVSPAGGAFQLYFRHYRTADGIISVAAMSPGLFAKFHAATGIDPPTVRDANDPSFQAVVTAAEERFAARTTAEWLETLQAVGYPCGPYNMPHESVRDPQVVANDFVVELDHPSFGPYVTSGMPLRMEKARCEVRGPSPRLAEHTVDVMTEIGLDAGTIEDLLAAGTLVDGGAT
ncbi:MAG: CaiB/BaiF CoA transferase family protein [Acidimicrobiales bacterium]